MNPNISRSLLAAAVFAATLALSGCSSARQARWCELDETDEVVANSFCESGAPGFEWEPDGDKRKTKYVSKTSTSKTTPKPAPTSTRR